MTFGSVFGRTFSPTFQPSSQAAAASGGWWDLNGTITSCVAAYQPKGAASYAASLVNLTGDDTYDATEGVSTVPWDATDGWKGDGTNYLDTGITPSGQWTMIVKASQLDYSTQNHLCGLYSHTSFGDDLISRFYIGIVTYLYTGYNNKAMTINTVPTSGVFAVTYQYGYIDGSPDITMGADASLDTNPRTVFILARNYSNTYFPTTAYIQSFAIYNATLTETQVGNLTTAMAAL